jgi:hypothetical protein
MKLLYVLICLMLHALVSSAQMIKKPTGGSNTGAATSKPKETGAFITLQAGRSSLLVSTMINNQEFGTVNPGMTKRVPVNPGNAIQVLLTDQQGNYYDTMVDLSGKVAGKNISIRFPELNYPVLKTGVDALGRVMDTDRDGIEDAADLEWRTPAGAPVDARGRSKDTDGDGIPDYKDLEKNTSRRCFPVNADGTGNCPAGNLSRESDPATLLQRAQAMNLLAGHLYRSSADIAKELYTLYLDTRAGFTGTSDALARYASLAAAKNQYSGKLQELTRYYDSVSYLGVNKRSVYFSDLQAVLHRLGLRITDMTALLEKGREEKFFAGLTPGKSVATNAFAGNYANLLLKANKGSGISVSVNGESQGTINADMTRKFPLAKTQLRITIADTRGNYYDTSFAVTEQQAGRTIFIEFPEMDYIQKTQITADGREKDSDGDGIPDSFDREPGTPADAPVDREGRATDADSDGVPDYRDKEPLTSTRCFPVDSEGKGLCPEQPAKPGIKEIVTKAASLARHAEYLSASAQALSKEINRYEALKTTVPEIQKKYKEFVASYKQLDDSGVSARKKLADLSDLAIPDGTDDFREWESYKVKTMAELSELTNALNHVALDLAELSEKANGRGQPQ